VRFLVRDAVDVHVEEAEEGFVDLGPAVGLAVVDSAAHSVTVDCVDDLVVVPEVVVVADADVGVVLLEIGNYVDCVGEVGLSVVADLRDRMEVGTCVQRLILEYAAAVDAEKGLAVVVAAGKVLGVVETVAAEMGLAGVEGALDFAGEGLDVAE
jgi:hypothetical protein